MEMEMEMEIVDPLENYIYTFDLKLRIFHLSFLRAGMTGMSPHPYISFHALTSKHLIKTAKGSGLQSKDQLLASTV